MRKSTGRTSRSCSTNSSFCPLPCSGPGPSQKPRETSTEKSSKEILAPWPQGKKRKFCEKSRKEKTEVTYCATGEVPHCPTARTHVFVDNCWLKPFFMRVSRSPAAVPGESASVELGSSLPVRPGAGRCGEEDSPLRERPRF